MSTAKQEDISSQVLRSMKEGGFDFSRIHPIEFYATFPDEAGAREAAGQFRGESINAQVCETEDGAWQMELCKFMFATHGGIGEFSLDIARAIAPFGGEVEGWGVKHEIRRANA